MDGANGDGPRYHPLLKPLNLPPLGRRSRRRLWSTKTLLFVTEGDQINVRTPARTAAARRSARSTRRPARSCGRPSSMRAARAR